MFLDLFAREIAVIAQTPSRQRHTGSLGSEPIERLWTIQEAAHYAGIQPKTLFNRISEHKAQHNGKFPDYCVTPRWSNGRPRINPAKFRRTTQEKEIARSG